MNHLVKKSIMTADIENIYRKIREGSTGTLLTAEQIQAFRYRKTRNFFRRMSVTIWLNTGIKLILVAGLAGLIALSLAQPDMVMLLAVLIAVCIGLIVYELSLTRSLKILSEGTERTSALLRRMNRFLSVQFSYFRMLGALTNPILVLTGIFYYQYFKRQEIGFADVEDIIVTLVILIISYLLAMIGNHFSRMSMKAELADLQMIDEDPAGILSASRKRKTIIAVISLTVLLLGLLLFLVFLFSA